jgi:hypothetical protein
MATNDTNKNGGTIGFEAEMFKATANACLWLRPTARNNVRRPY